MLLRWGYRRERPLAFLGVGRRCAAQAWRPRPGRSRAPLRRGRGAARDVGQQFKRKRPNQFSWRYEAPDRLLAGKDIREDDVPTWFWTFQPEHFDKGLINARLAKLYQLKGNLDFLYSQGGYAYFFANTNS